MGTNYTGDESNEGVIPKVMERIFSKVEAAKDSKEFLIRVSFIEVHFCYVVTVSESYFSLSLAFKHSF